MSLAAPSVSGKILAIFFPVGRRPGNWLLAGAGNLVGAVVFVSTSYWYLFLKDAPGKAPAAEEAEPAERA